MRKEIVLFLDIDGVLNDKEFLNKSWKDYAERNPNKFPSPMEKALLEINKEKVNILNTIICNNDWKIPVVISSTWRLYFCLSELKEIFSLCGFVGEIIGITPDLHRRRMSEAVPRVKEIEEWMKNNIKYLDYVTIDDQPIGDRDKEKMHQIFTEEDVGLTLEIAENCKSLLMEKLFVKE